MTFSEIDVVRTLAIVGAGFSGTLLALHALRLAPAGTEVVLIERGRRFGNGRAYASGNPHHVLNVPAGRMSAFHDRPGDFLAWLQARPDWRDSTAQSFVPRDAFGRYVRSLLKAELRKADVANRLTLVGGAVQGIRQDGAQMCLTLDRDRKVQAEIVVLATGNFPPEPPRVADPSFYDGALFRRDPWSPEAVEGLAPSDPVLLIGTGLTAVDMVVSLLDQGHTGPITALSRRGLLPLRHVAAPAAPPKTPHSYPSRVVPLLRLLRRQAADVVAEGGPWQAAVDALRPSTQDIWQAMPLRDRAAFLRHLRPWWDVHRHRMAPAVAARIAAAQSSGQLQIRRGRIQAYHVTCGDRVEVRFRLPPRQGGGVDGLTVARVINCAGPSCDYERTDDPLLRSLLDTGLGRPDALRLGLDVTANCAVLELSGAVSRQIFAVGPITRSVFWEMTAVPDLRRQCEALAGHLAGLLGQMPVAKPGL